MVSPGVNFSGQNLFSQMIAQMPKKDLSEVNPMDSLSKVTAPLDNIWKALGSRLNIQGINDVKSFLSGSTSGPLKSSLEESYGSPDTSTGRTLEIVKYAFVLTANIFVAVLELALWILKGILGFIT